MADYDNTNRGALFTNKKKEKDNHPDLQGSITVKGPDGNTFEMWVSGWMKVSQKGDDYISLSLTEKQETSSGKTLADMKNKAKSGSLKEQKSFSRDLDDEIPF